MTDALFRAPRATFPFDRRKPRGHNQEIHRGQPQVQRPSEQRPDTAGDQQVADSGQSMTTSAELAIGGQALNACSGTKELRCTARTKPGPLRSTSLAVMKPTNS